MMQLRLTVMMKAKSALALFLRGSYTSQVDGTHEAGHVVCLEAILSGGSTRWKVRQVGVGIAPGWSKASVVA
jgi:hypothetical protein